MLYILEKDYTMEDVANATKEELYYSFYHGYDYPLDIWLKIAGEMSLRGM